MSQAIAAVARSSTKPAVEASQPTVFVDGVPDPRFVVHSLTSALPADQRTAALARLPAAAEMPVNHPELTLAVPHALADGSVRWRVLLSGRLSRTDTSTAAGTDRDDIVLQDALASMLDEPADTAGQWPAEGFLLDVLLQRIASMLQAELVVACDAVRLSAELGPPTSATQALADLLLPALDDAGVVIRQSMRLLAGRAVRVLTILPARRGRRVALPWPDPQGAGGAVRSVNASAQASPSRAWAALGDRPRVEDTFELQPGWDPSLEGRPDSDYGRLTSTDYARYGPVFRAWVLNEDGAYSHAPFNRPAYDAGALFDAPGTVSKPLPLQDCLATDASGRALSPVIESSTDGGSTWSAYPGLAEPMRDRAGVVLTDDTLPAAVLSAAKADTLRVRVTASLTGPEPIEARRWDGNPFTGSAPTRVLRFGGRFRWRRVAPTSTHSAAVDAGLLLADTADDRAAMRSALLERVAESPSDGHAATLELAGAWTGFEAGDLVPDPLGRGTAIDGTPASFGARAMRIAETRVVFGVSQRSPMTRFRLD